MEGVSIMDEDMWYEDAWDDEDDYPRVGMEDCE